MYVPKHFDAPEAAWCHALIAGESFALLVSTGADGTPFATHLPLLLDSGRGPHGTLLGHVARANPHARLLAAAAPTLAVFQGPHAYVSPAWYAVHPSVPTWNYVAVHATGRPTLIEEPARVKALLDRLVTTYEARSAAPWRFESLAADYVDGMMRGIVAFELPIERLEGKAKLSQNRGAEDRAGAIRGLEATGAPLAIATAALMRGVREG
ncbi:MAG TPA: FMN-binding negative transcriptional regulator [Methylomirabilota bacterium]|nr:FMN-binding negative transcriptional regulator [Methylomirabilota bacterium]